MDIDIRNRKYFVKEVANTIKNKHGKEKNASFIFGISGKWGEGKTVFLEHLKRELQEFTPIEINPWKFSNERVSFLRYFLLQLKNIEKEKRFILKKTEFPQKPSKFNNVKEFLNYRLGNGKARFRNHKDWLKYYSSIYFVRIQVLLNGDKFSNLSVDISKSRVNLGRLLIVLFGALLVISIYFSFPKYLGGLVPTFVKTWVESHKLEFKALLSLLGITALLASFASWVITSQVSNKAVSTLDQFDGLLDEILSHLAHLKLLVIVDDLDRVTPSMARDVLDNLRTFFDKKELSFVVTGDHTVLERYIGGQLMEGAEEAEKLEEGRRYLKKIFNVYWRLPMPIENDFDSFLGDLENDGHAVLLSIFLTEESIKKFRYYLGKFFDSNYREVQRFYETVLFTFRIIKLRIKEASSGEKLFLEDLTKWPLLVIRVLMLQEFCTPFFEVLLRDNSVLFKVENAIEKSNEAVFTDIIAPIKMTDSQRKFLRNFLSEEPRFYKNGSTDVNSIKPFLLLAADASLVSSRGPTPEAFMGIFATNDATQISEAIISGGNGSVKESANAVLSSIKSQADNAQKNTSLKLLLASLNKIPADHFSHNIFLEGLKDIDISFLVDPAEKFQMFAFFIGWLNQIDLEKTEEYIDKFPYSNPTDFDHLGELPTGLFRDTVVSRWLVSYYNNDKSSSLDKILEIAPTLNPEVVKKELTSVAEDIAATIVSDGDSATREKRLAILQAHTNNGEDAVKRRVLSELANRNLSIWEWSISQVSKSIWTREELESQVISNLRDAQTADQFVEAFDFANEKLTSYGKLWDVVRSKKVIFPDIFTRAAGNTYVWSPDDITAKILLREVLKKIKSIPSDEDKNYYIDFLKKDNWLWRNLEAAFAIQAIESFMKKESDVVKNKCEEIIATWKVEA